jgi:hypothetical protein
MNVLNDNRYLQNSGPFEARYLAFLETISTLRPSLHRYCARMTGSVMDGEDVVQETLFEAYRKLDKFDESRPLKPWLFGSRTTVVSISCDAGECGTKPMRLSLCPRL